MQSLSLFTKLRRWLAIKLAGDMLIKAQCSRCVSDTLINQGSEIAKMESSRVLADLGRDLALYATIKHERIHNPPSHLYTATLHILK